MNEIVKKVKEYVLNINKEYLENSVNNKYNFYNEHLKYVVKNSLDLAREYNADVEIVEIGAWLHDIARMLKVGTAADHHINGAKIAEELLKEFDYPDEKIKKVKDIVLHHRSSKNAENIEELCVADADIISHYDNILMSCSSIFGLNQMDLSTGRRVLRESLKKELGDISERSRHIIEKRYHLLNQLLHLE
jgi:uncharacterized protein